MKGTIKPADKNIEKAKWITPKSLLASLEKNNYPQNQLAKIRKFLESC
ncbi:MAG: hypothetical protein ABIB61_01290 [Candidatus Shapirobacteria bacterium]